MKNLVDLAILGIIGVCVVFGLFQGGLVSFFHTVGFFLSWGIARLNYPKLSLYIQANDKWMELFLHYADGAKRVPKIAMARTSIGSLTQMDITGAIQQADLPVPFDRMIQENILARVLEPLGKSTLGDYFNYSIVVAALNVISFVAILFGVYIVLCVLINLCNYVIKLPEIRHLDWAVGGLCGLLRGVFMVHVFVSLLPVMLAIMPSNIGFINDILDASRLLPAYYEGNHVLKFIKGWIVASG